MTTTIVQSFPKVGDTYAKDIPTFICNMDIYANHIFMHDILAAHLNSTFSGDIFNIYIFYSCSMDCFSVIYMVT